jgi:hypothetical protein
MEAENDRRMGEKMSEAERQKLLGSTALFNKPVNKADWRKQEKTLTVNWYEKDENGTWTRHFRSISPETTEIIIGPTARYVQVEGYDSEHIHRHGEGYDWSRSGK